MRKRTIYEKYLKRIMDVFLSGLAIIILSPALGIVALLVHFKLGSPILFKQARPGKDEKIFYLYKFRSMTNAVDKDGKLLPDSERLTKLGKILRKTSIDELPELINILKGDMSIVGPRPLSIYYLPHYSGVSKRRHDVRPGLTGLAQVRGRNNLQWDDRFALDALYVDHVTFFTDIKIIIETVLKVVRAADISVRGTTKVYDYGTYKKIKEEGNAALTEYDMTYSEIGSYFWLDKNIIPKNDIDINFMPVVSDYSYTFSGRSAIEIAIKDALKYKNIKTAYVPSYCCISMLQPFINHNIKYEFYDVSFNDGKIEYLIDESIKCDIFLYMEYFGLKHNDLDEILHKLNKKGIIIIEDITHSILNEKPYHVESTYLVSSLRKWFEIPTGGWIGKLNGNLKIKPSIDSNHTVVDKINGMDLKRRYLNGESLSKEEFLKINSKFDNDLIHVDRMLKIDTVSLSILENTDINILKEQRRANATVLKNNLSSINVITLPDMNLEHDTPLFYPIFLETENRDSLRKYLIENRMYCPVHWPEVMGADAGIRKNELSLICDQRYTEKDMLALSQCIQDWYIFMKG